MALINAEQVQAKWPTWQVLLDSITVQGQTSAQLLQTAIDLAIDEWGHYRGDEDDDMDDTLRMHLLKLVKKHAFDMRHGDKTYKEKERPQILRDYDAVIEKLENNLIGGDNINISSKDRIMDEGFLETENLWYESTS